MGILMRHPIEHLLLDHTQTLGHASVSLFPHQWCSTSSPYLGASDGSVSTDAGTFAWIISDPDGTKLVTGKG